MLHPSYLGCSSIVLTKYYACVILKYNMATVFGPGFNDLPPPCFMIILLTGRL